MFGNAKVDQILDKLVQCVMFVSHYQDLFICVTENGFGKQGANERLSGPFVLWSQVVDHLDDFPWGTLSYVNDGGRHRGLDCRVAPPARGEATSCGRTEPHCLTFKY